MAGTRKHRPEHGRDTVLSSAVCLLTAALCGATTTGCHRSPRPLPAPADSLDVVVAKIDGQPVTARDLVTDVSGRSQFYRQSFKAPGGEQKLVDTLLRFEVMAKEARDRGYDKDPEVIRTAKQRMIDKLVQHEQHTYVGVVPPTSVEAYYASHLREFGAPERVRIREVVLQDKALAGRVLSQAARLPRNDEQGFRALASRFAEDQPGRVNGGGIETLDRTSTRLPPAVVEAAFRLTAEAPVGGPVEAEHRFYVLRLLERLPASIRPLAEVRAEIERRLSTNLSSQHLEDWSAGVHAKHKVEVYADKLQGIDFTAQ